MKTITITDRQEAKLKRELNSIFGWPAMTPGTQPDFWFRAGALQLSDGAKVNSLPDQGGGPIALGLAHPDNPAPTLRRNRVAANAQDIGRTSLDFLGSPLVGSGNLDTVTPTVLAVVSRDKEDSWQAVLQIKNLILRAMCGSIPGGSWGVEYRGQLFSAGVPLGYIAKVIAVRVNSESSIDLFTGGSTWVTRASHTVAAGEHLNAQKLWVGGEGDGYRALGGTMPELHVYSQPFGDDELFEKFRAAQCEYERTAPATS